MGVCIRDTQRGDRDHLLTRHRQTFTARRQHRDLRTPLLDRGDNLGGRVEPVLAIVSTSSRRFVLR